MRRLIVCNWLLCAFVFPSASASAQGMPAASPAAELRLHLVPSSAGKDGPVPAVAWLESLPGTPELPLVAHGSYTLLQKNRTFIPHLLVIPVGSIVRFPNADPFFHNVFSLYEGKRFDLGLYEAGSSKSVAFSRKGVSYIFCNIHPEMSAVVLTLSTPFYAVADTHNAFDLRGVPPGEYMLHLWIEGVPPSYLEHLTRPVHLSARVLNLGAIKAPIAQPRAIKHRNLYDEDYDRTSHPTY